MQNPVVIIGGGPAGLFAAEYLAKAGFSVHVYDRKPSLARKFLMAGRGGLNLTHSEPLETFLTRYGAAQSFLAPLIEQFTPQDLRDWCEGLGQETFVGTSGRVFPKAMKASPLLRAWLTRLETLGVKFHLQTTWRGWDGDALLFNNMHGDKMRVQASATLLTLGGASWPNLGSDGAWVSVMAQRGVPVSPLRPANCGFMVAWSDVFKEKFAGTPLKNIALHVDGRAISGEMIVTEKGVEGGAVYAQSSCIRDLITRDGEAIIHIDVKPEKTQIDIVRKLEASPIGRQSFSTYLKKTLNLSPVAINLLRETNKAPQSLSASELAALIKSVPLQVASPFAIDRAISSAGGIRLDALDSAMMLKDMGGVFVAGEMLDWEAPTGGYLLQACFATGVAAGRGIEAYLAAKSL